MSSNPERAFLYYLRICWPDHPELEAEYNFGGVKNWRFDFAFVPQQIAIEINGGRWKVGGGRHNTPGDYEKMQAACALGWRVFPVLPEQLNNDPQGVIDRLREAYNL